MVADALNQKVKDAFILSEEFIVRSKNKVVPGSDQHLDEINGTTALFNTLIEVLSKVNNSIERNFPQSAGDANDLKFGINSLHGSLESFIKIIKKNNLFYSSHRDCINRLEIECNQIGEYIEDLNEYVISNDDIIPDDIFNGW